VFFKIRVKPNPYIQHLNLRLRFGYHRFKIRVHMEVTQDFVTKYTLRGTSGFINER